MKRYTIRDFKYESGSPMSRLQELENKVEDGELIEVEEAEQTVNEYSITYFYETLKRDIGYGRTTITVKGGTVYTAERIRKTEKEICQTNGYKNAVIIYITPLEREDTE